MDVTPTAIDALFDARKSVRRFAQRPVPRSLLERLMALATTAPSASNKQPWRFVIVRDPTVISAMASAVRDEIARVRAHMDPSGLEAFTAYGAYFTRFEEAPCVIVPTCRPTAVLSQLVTSAIDPDARGRIAAMERTSAVVSTSLAIENLLLAAPALGLGASALTGPLLAAHRIAELAKVPPSWELLALIAVGYPDETPRATERKPVAQVLRWIGGDDEGHE
jgi:nitroreductase